MKYLLRTFGLIILISTIGCNSKNDNSAFMMVDEDIAIQNPKKKNDQILERKLIKEGIVEFEVCNVDSTRIKIFKAVEKYNGYISSDQEFEETRQIINTLIIRVPAKNFNLLMSEATHGVKKFDIKDIEIKDVTEEFLDINARLKTKKELENRYLEILEKANKVTEILEIEKQIGILRSEIESVEGRLKYLENRISFSTLNVTFYQTISKETEFGIKFKNGLKNGWDNLIWFFVYLTNIWPFILIAIGLIIGIRIWKRKK
jgi:hypothetical protein